MLLQKSVLGYEPTLAGAMPPSTAPVPNSLDGSCCTHPNCTQNGAWCQTTGYNSLIVLGGGQQFSIVYDRLANGWGGPPGQWGAVDRVFSVRFTLK